MIFKLYDDIIIIFNIMYLFFSGNFFILKFFLTNLNLKYSLYIFKIYYLILNTIRFNKYF